MRLPRYESIVPQEKHLQTKAETFTVEGYNSPFRHFSARMRRKSDCCSKKPETLKISVLLLTHHGNGTLSILDWQCRILFIFPYQFSISGS